MDYRVLTEAERKYTFSQSQQLSMQTGLIGYLRADFGSTGNEFWTTWNDFRKDLKTDEFKAEFDDVINGLRDGDVLSGRKAMSSYCYSTPDSSFNDDRNHYGIRLDTEKYSYLMRFNPNRGEYNLYCYCYQKEWLNNHLKNAERGIRFIDPHYQEQFRITDGEKISIKLGDGKTMERTCRYIDDYHLEVGTNLYHICEFAELCERNGHTVEPVSYTHLDVYKRQEQSIDKYVPQEVHRVTGVAGQVANVNFNNVLKRGYLQVIKSSEDNLFEGVTFHLSGTSLAGIAVDEYAVTDKNGVASFDDVLILSLIHI